jgi:asparagine synthase (glutamine-hydrolysing)
MGSVRDADALAARLHGCFHLAVSVGGEVRVQGNLTGVRRVFHVPAGTVTIAADRADVLAHLTAAAVDESALALRLLFPQTPHPLDTQPIWDGIHAVPGDCFLSLDPTGRPGVIRWWHCPPPQEPFADSAARLRQVLRAAVATRSDTGLPVSADLSGGLDSTSLCFLAAEQGPLVTFRQQSADPGNEDPAWAQTAAHALPDADHVVADLSDLPGKYAPPGDSDPEDVYFWMRSQADLRAIASKLAATGSRVHLTGHGGDEVLATGPAHLHLLARRHPLTAMRHIRGHQAIRRWQTSTVLRELLDGSNYELWLRRCGDHLLEPPLERRTANLSWAGPPRLPSWVTPRAAELVTDRLHQAAQQQPRPLAPTRYQHQTLYYAGVTGRIVRQTCRIFHASNVALETPYLDDRVIETALAVRPQDRGHPGRYKPLLTEAMTGIVPDRNLTRTTKGQFGAEVYRGLRRHRAHLLDMLDDSILAGIGLIDRDAVHRAVSATYPTSEPLWQLEMTLACEHWLRTQQSMARTPHRRTP